jgi:hypothetical protein
MVSGHQFFFGAEVKRSVFDQLIQNFAHGFLAVAAVHGVEKFIDDLYQFLVLVVDLGDANAEIVAPGDQGHERYS